MNTALAPGGARSGYRAAVRREKPSTLCVDPRPVRQSPSGFARCGRCDPCKAHRAEVTIGRWKRRISPELRWSLGGSLWLRLSVSDEHMPAFEADPASALKGFFQKLRRGTVRARPWDGLTRDGLYRISPEPLPALPVPRTAAARLAAGFIKPQALMSFLWQLERSEAGRLHAHVLLHPHPENPLDPGAVAEAWSLGYVGVKPCGGGKKDANNIAYYLAKYIQKNGPLGRRGASLHYGKRPKLSDSDGVWLGAFMGKNDAPPL